jgi:hypothetical protein
MIDYSTGDPYTSGPWSRSGDVFACATNPTKLIARLPATPKFQGFASIGNKKAIYSEWIFSCTSTDGTGEKPSFTERTWWLPTTKLLVVDDWNTPGLAEALKNATWS